MGTDTQIVLNHLPPGYRVPLGYDEWLISAEEAEHIRSCGGTAAVNGVSVPVIFIEKWERVNGEVVHVTGSGS